MNTPIGWEWKGTFFFIGCYDIFSGNLANGLPVKYICNANGTEVANTSAFATIGVYSSDFVTISNVIFPGGNGQAIFLMDVTNSLIEGVDTGLGNLRGIELKDSCCVPVPVSSNIVFRNNNIHDCRGNGWRAIVAPTSITNFTIDNNTFARNVSGLSLRSRQNTVTNNVFTRNGPGIQIIAEGNTVTDNVIQGNQSGLGIFATNNIFRRNIISGNTVNVDFGVSPFMPASRLDNVFDATNLVEGRTVLLLKNPVNETITGDHAMILVFGGDNITLQGVTTANNNAASIALVQTSNSSVVGATVGAARIGIHIAGGQNNLVLNNSLVAPLQPLRRQLHIRGILLNSSSGNLVSGNLVDGYLFNISIEGPNSVNNTVDGNTVLRGQLGVTINAFGQPVPGNNVISNNDITAAQVGIDLRDQTNNLITGNVIHDVRFLGIQLLASQNTITNNLFFGQGTLFVRGDIWDAASNLHTNNRIFGNDFFSGVTIVAANQILCEPNTLAGIGNFYDRTVPPDKTPFGPCGIASDPFTPGGLTRPHQAVEQCRNGRDDDGDGPIDLADPDCADSLFTEIEAPPCTDADGDGFALEGGICGSVDCDDDVAACNTDCTSQLFEDADLDGFGNPAAPTRACDAPAGFITDNTDCNDAEAGDHPGAVEVCLDNRDNNCDGQIDECTPEQNVQALIGNVQDLIDANVLDQEGNGLLGIVAAALASVENDRPSAIAQLNAFISAVEGFISGGLLTAEQGQALIAAAQSIIDQLSL